MGCCPSGSNDKDMEAYQADNDKTDKDNNKQNNKQEENGPDKENKDPNTNKSQSLSNNTAHASKDSKPNSNAGQSSTAAAVSPGTGSPQEAIEIQQSTNSPAIPKMNKSRSNISNKGYESVGDNDNDNDNDIDINDDNNNNSYNNPTEAEEEKDDNNNNNNNNNENNDENKNNNDGEYKKPNEYGNNDDDGGSISKIPKGKDPYKLNNKKCRIKLALNNDNNEDVYIQGCKLTKEEDIKLNKLLNKIREIKKIDKIYLPYILPLLLDEIIDNIDNNYSNDKFDNLPGEKLPLPKPKEPKLPNPKPNDNDHDHGKRKKASNNVFAEGRVYVWNSSSSGWYLCQDFIGSGDGISTTTDPNEAAILTFESCPVNENLYRIYGIDVLTENPYYVGGEDGNYSDPYLAACNIDKTTVDTYDNESIEFPLVIWGLLEHNSYQYAVCSYNNDNRSDNWLKYEENSTSEGTYRKFYCNGVYGGSAESDTLVYFSIEEVEESLGSSSS